MKKVIICMSLLFAFKGVAQNCYEVVGYYPNWQWYDRNKLVTPNTIDYSKYTILNYAFLVPEADGTISLFDPWADENLLLGQIDWSTGGHFPNTSLIDIAHSNGVKVLPSIGGFTLSNNFPGIAADPNKRAIFAQSCVTLIQMYKFDGIDLDWEYPGFADHSGTPQDKANFPLLLQDIRTAIDNYGASIGKTMLLTAAVGAAEVRMENVDWPAVEPLLDIINLMSYDYFGTWDATTNHNAPLFAPSQGDVTFNLEHSVNKLIIDYGVNPNKLTAGVPFYGRTTKTNSTPVLHGPSTGVADNITFQEDEGTPLYYNVLQKLSLFNENWDNVAKVPYLTGKDGLNTFISYDDLQSIELKAQFIVEKQLRGAIIWEITGDYIETFPGSGQVSGTPLVSKLNDVFCNYIPGNLDVNSIDHAVGTVYPNPAINAITIQGDSYLGTEIELVDLKGSFLFRQKMTHTIQSVNLDNVSPGSYMVKVITQNSIDYHKLIVAE